MFNNPKTLLILISALLFISSCQKREIAKSEEDTYTIASDFTLLCRDKDRGTTVDDLFIVGDKIYYGSNTEDLKIAKWFLVYPNKYLIDGDFSPFGSATFTIDRKKSTLEIQHIHQRSTLFTNQITYFFNYNCLLLGGQTALALEKRALFLNELQRRKSQEELQEKARQKAKEEYDQLKRKF